MHFSGIFDFQSENSRVFLFFASAFREYDKHHMDFSSRHFHSVSGSIASPHLHNYFAVFLLLIEKNLNVCSRNGSFAL